MVRNKGSGTIVPLSHCLPFALVWGRYHARMKTPRITLRCYTEDLGLALPGLDRGLESDHPIAEELKERAPTAPVGLKRILSIRAPLVYRLQRGRHRGAAWPDEARRVLWLLATGLRREGSLDDAYRHFARLHEAGRLSPNDDDDSRLKLEAAARLYKVLCAGVAVLLREAQARPGECVSSEFDGEIPCRLLLEPGRGVDELRVAVSTVTSAGTGVEVRVRDMIFALVESAAGRGEWEAVSMWPKGDLRWFEVARYGLLEGRNALHGD
jgi:hypothetical protein